MHCRHCSTPWSLEAQRQKKHEPAFFFCHKLATLMPRSVPSVTVVALSTGEELTSHRDIQNHRHSETPPFSLESRQAGYSRCMKMTLEKGEAVLCERYVWLGPVYSCALAPKLDIRTFMCVDMGLMAPDLLIYVDTPLAQDHRCHPYLRTQDFKIKSAIYAKRPASGKGFGCCASKHPKINGSLDNAF